MLTIINFEDRYAADFRRLNLEWLEQYQLTEAHDLDLINAPRQHIINNGGCIFLARENDVIIGCAGLMKVTDQEYLLVKMSVTAACQGRGISKLLLVRCLEEARRLGATKLGLLSNHQLRKALQLYRQFGFKEVPLAPSPFELADVQMELFLND